MTKSCCIALIIVVVGSSLTFADIVQFDLAGNAGAGLLPGNENPPVTSGATGSEIGSGIVFDTDTNTLSLEFEFQGLTGGLIDAAGGIHIHDAGPVNPLDNNGGIVFLLNENEANVAIGSTAGSIDLDLVLTDAQESALFADQYYINIHSAGFGSGELRGNLVQAIPEPSTGLALLVAISVAIRRRSRS